jgi:glycosyltransferase involved in cell wall biosynthesis
VPIYNDGAEAERFCIELERVLKAYLETEKLDELIEVLFIDDGSRNDSVAKLCALTSRFKWARIIQLSRNFGQHIAQSCGYSYVSGRYVATMNVDMQDPPYELPRLLDRI